jgi:hypothetical protein
MIATEAGNLLGNEATISGDFESDIISGEGENALDAILELGGEGETALAAKEGIGRPGGAPEDPGGVGAGCHGGDIFVVALDEDILGFVHFEKEVSGSADDIGTWLTGEEKEAGLTEAVDVAMLSRPTATGELIGIEDALQAAHGIEGLGLPGGGDFDQLGGKAGEAGEEVGFELSLELVLAGLAGKDDDEAEAAGVEDAIYDGAGDRDLVGAEGKAAEEGGKGGGVEEHQGASA